MKSSKFDKKISNKQTVSGAKSSYAQYQNSRSKFKKKSVSSYKSNYKNNKLSQKVNHNKRFDYDNDASARSRYYSSSGWRAPGYIYNSRPSFGMWDSMCLWMMLSNLSRPGYSQTFYNHQNDVGIQEWRREADELARTNAELREKLNELDAATAGMNGPIDPSFLPEGIPASIALAPEALAAMSSSTPVLRFATASKTGNYNYFGGVVKSKASGIDVELLNTSGSWENLDLLVNGKVDAAMVQSDALMLYKALYPDVKLVTEQTVIYPEAVQMIANRDSGIKSVKDINPDKHILYIGPKGSGTAMTWKAFCVLDSRYKKIPTRTAGYDQALQEVRENPYAVMMFVSGLNSEFIHKANQLASSGTGLQLVTVDDWDFNDVSDSDGNDVYKFVEIPSGVYPALQKGWIFGHDIETIAVESVMVLKSDWIDRNGAETLDSLSSAIVEAKSIMQKRISAKGN
ncbi:TAXI family TRAP transporter solute-binding subunit [Maridesulfovibrio zosterae]|uniref:TAXI family TRAP transporter solute-binding subunit n=1 Tax=Maridesulfovibrio zosterae TaxID=82171 RepID=UPI0004853909|nr:TAXI family TRAP transporter solute-binding subunit [Maridesulfovibrio zosterae]